MQRAQPLEIKVVYSASGRRRRSPRRVRATTARPTASRASLALGLVTLVVSGSLTYATWQRVDRFIFLTFMWRTPVPGLNAQMAGAFVPPAGPRVGLPATPSPAEEDGTSTPPLPVPIGPRITGLTATTVIGACGYTWLTLSTISCCLLAIAGGAACASATGAVVRALATIVLVLGWLAVGYYAYKTFMEFGTSYRPSTLRAGMCALVFLAAMYGLALGKRFRRVWRWAAVSLIVAAVMTTISLYLGHLSGAIDAPYATPSALALAFVGHSAFGWLLLVFGRRVLHA